jgi:Uncharacterized protein conserved in bacteria (DUF2330)
MLGRRRGRTVRRMATVLVGSGFTLTVLAGPALACGGLVSPNGTVALVRTTTLAAYHDGVEHYVTGFQFAGGGAKFGSIVPLPAVPTKVIRGGNWTLQRLEIEVSPPVFATAAPSASPAAGALEDKAVVILKKQIDSLDITVLTGGGFAVGRWATKHGFALSPDAPEMLDFYAKRSPVFMAVQFNAKRARARGENLGDAIPVHLVIPTDRPWVPLRILGLGAKTAQPIDADVFLLTDRKPTLLPAPQNAPRLGAIAPGLRLERSESASGQLLLDLRSDRGMKWMPKSNMWLSYLQLRTKAGQLHYDLAIDASGAGRPSAVDAGLATTPAAGSPSGNAGVWAVWAVGALLVLLFALAVREQRRSSNRVAY